VPPEYYILIGWTRRGTYLFLNMPFDNIWPWSQNCF